MVVPRILELKANISFTSFGFVLRIFVQALGDNLSVRPNMRISGAASVTPWTQSLDVEYRYMGSLYDSRSMRWGHEPQQIEDEDEKENEDEKLDEEDEEEHEKTPHGRVAQRNKAQK